MAGAVGGGLVGVTIGRTAVWRDVPITAP
jgi:hypothetical protein